MWSEYFIPATLDEALELLSSWPAAGARVIAGGTDLVIELERGIRRPGALIDISRLPGLDTIRLDEAGFIHLGPLVTHSQVTASRLCVEQAFPLAQACRQVGAPQIRNRGTIAGNLITASPANDTITPLMALGATLTLTSQRGSRRLALSDFYTGVRRTVMADDEILTDIAFPALDTDRQCGAFFKLGLRRAQAISVVNCAAVLTLDGQRLVGRKTTGGRRAEAGAGTGAEPTVNQARLALGAVAPTIVRAGEAEESLTGRRLTAEGIERAARLAPASASPIDDVRATATYRRQMITVAVRRVLGWLMHGSERDDWEDRPARLTLPSAKTPTGKATGAAEDGTNPTGSVHFSDTRTNAIRLTVNGREYAISGAQDKTLLRLLREDCGLTGTKEGCSEGECGACTVILDGQAVMACLVPAPRAHGAHVVTIEGVSRLALQPEMELHPLQEAFIAEGAVQCGYCTPGLIMSGAALLAEHPHPNGAQIREAVSGNLCRCTGYYKILSAIERAAVQSSPQREAAHDKP